jgi:hypothetical protein
MSTDSHRLSILTAEEIEELYGLPRFTSQDRDLYFDLSVPEQAAIAAHSPSVAAYFILQLGYFKAKQQFFNIDQHAVADDLRYILDRYFPGRSFASIKMPSRPTRVGQQQSVLTQFDYRLFDMTTKNDLERRAQHTSMLSTQPNYILREALKYLSNQRIVAPVVV